jgi:paraquat-inducible protein B
MADAQGFMNDVDEQAVSLGESIRKTAEAATAASQEAQRTLGAAEGVIGKDSPMKYQLTRSLEEFSAAARSIRVLAEYLERHPEALLSGKGGSWKETKK